MGIAVLLGGGEGDRYAVVQAVALAKRTGEMVHGLRQESPLTHFSPGQPESSCPGLTLLLQLCDSAGITVRCHVLGRNDSRDLLAFLREQRIFCLIVGAEDEAGCKRAEARMEALRRSIASDRRWSLGSFWGMVTGPWSEKDMAAALDDRSDAADDEGLAKRP